MMNPVWFISVWLPLVMNVIAFVRSTYRLQFVTLSQTVFIWNAGGIKEW